ncbi:MAG: helix-turn-helix domain-containing protein [Pseudonocardiaceae bacterium]
MRGSWSAHRLVVTERALIRDRTNAGLAAARAAGRVGGRRPKLTERQTAQARKMHADGETVTAIADVLGVARSTVYRALDRDVPGEHNLRRTAG